MVLSGNRHSSAEWPSPSKYWTNLLDCVVFPHRSNPSRTTKAPLELLLEPLKMEFWLVPIRIFWIKFLYGTFGRKLEDILVVTTPKLLNRKNKHQKYINYSRGLLYQSFSKENCKWTWLKHKLSYAYLIFLRKKYTFKKNSNVFLTNTP